MVWSSFYLISVCTAVLTVSVVSAVSPSLRCSASSVAAPPITVPLQFFGDSIAQGFSVSELERWPAVLSRALQSEELNFAVSGQEWVDGVANVYSNLHRELTTWMAYGTNDMIHGQTQIDQVIHSVQTAILFAALPSNALVDLRNSSQSQVTGIWSPTTLYGHSMSSIHTATLNGSARFNSTVIGRYIAFATTVFIGSSTTDHITASVTIDGQVTNPAMPLINTLEVTYLGVNFTSFLYWYDTGATGASQPHHISIVPGVSGKPSSDFYLDWVAGFDPAAIGSHAVIVAEFGPWDEVLWPPSNQPTIDSLRTATKRAVDQFRCVMGLPVYYVEGMYEVSIYGMTTTSHTDLLHPNAAGHAFIAEQGLRFMLSQSKDAANCYVDVACLQAERQKAVLQRERTKTTVGVAGEGGAGISGCTDME